MESRPLVLIVDDQPHIRLPLQYLVASLGQVDVITAQNGREAVDLAVTRRPTLILMDVMMPQVDGFTACKQIRQAWGDHKGQIWFITARGSSVDLEQARTVGAERCINKPFDPDLVLQAVRQALSLGVTTGAPTGSL